MCIVCSDMGPWSGPFPADDPDEQLGSAQRGHLGAHGPLLRQLSLCAAARPSTLLQHPITSSNISHPVAPTPASASSPCSRPLDTSYVSKHPSNSPTAQMPRLSCLQDSSDCPLSRWANGLMCSQSLE